MLALNEVITTWTFKLQFILYHSILTLKERKTKKKKLLKKKFSILLAFLICVTQYREDATGKCHLSY